MHALLIIILILLALFGGFKFAMAVAIVSLLGFTTGPIGFIAVFIIYTLLKDDNNQ
jgi:hypothetical protein